MIVLEEGRSRAQNRVSRDLQQEAAATDHCEVPLANLRHGAMVGYDQEVCGYLGTVLGD